MISVSENATAKTLLHLMSATTRKKKIISRLLIHSTVFLAWEVISPSVLDVSVASDVFTDDTTIPFLFVDETKGFPLIVDPWMHDLLEIGQLALYMRTRLGFSSEEHTCEVVPTTEPGI